MTILIIGKNSRAVESLRPFLGSEFTLISHSELSGLDLSGFRRIVVFSFSDNFIDNNALLNQLSGREVVYISSISALEVELKRNFVYSHYPYVKRSAEIKALQLGFMVIRAGQITGGKISKFPVTTDPQSLVNFLVNVEFKSGIFYNLQISKVTQWRRLNSFLHKDFPLWVNYLALLFSKFFGLKNVGYTRAASSFFAPVVVVGNGVLASSFLDGLSRENSGKCLVLESRNRVVDLKRDGFNGTLLGFNRGGLGRFWHGVEIVKKRDHLKKVPLFPYRPRKRKSLDFPVVSIHFCDISKMWLLRGLSVDEVMFCNKLVLGAGWFSNSMLLANFLGCSPIHFSDHEACKLGSLDLDELLSRGIFKRFGCLVYGRRVLREEFFDKPVLIDFRPRVEIDDQHFYRNSTFGILGKLVSQFNFSRLNQAFFNKFGFGLAVESFDVFAQVPIDNCIVLRNGDLERKRLDRSFWSGLSIFIRKRFNSFLLEDRFDSFDAQHVVGGSEILKNQFFRELVDQGYLTILGSPTPYQLTDVHHTNALKKDLPQMFM